MKAKFYPLPSTNTTYQRNPWNVKTMSPVNKKLFQEVVRAVKRKHPGTPTRVQQEKKKKGGPRLVGASHGKYKGNFKTKGSTRNVFDKDLLTGVMLKTEFGGVLSDTRNVTYIGHSTMPSQQILRLAWGSIVKRVFAKAQLKIKNWDEYLIPSPQTKVMRLRIYFKNRDQTNVDNREFVINPGVTTLITLVDAIILQFGTEGSRANTQQQLLSIQLANETSDVIPSQYVFANHDLTDCYIVFRVQAELKMQNRTINTLGNDQADDVDNVPIWGRSFDFKSNGTIFKDYNTPVAASDQVALTTDAVYGIVPSSSILPDPTGTTMYDDIPFPKQFTGTKSSSKVLLNPGDIKKSYMKDYMRVGLNKLYTLIYNRGDITVTETRRVFIGKTRLFAFEKVVNSVAATSDNAFKIAYEQSLKLSGVAYLPDKNQTAPKLYKLIV